MVSRDSKSVYEVQNSGHHSEQGPQDLLRVRGGNWTVKESVLIERYFLNYLREPKMHVGARSFFVCLTDQAKVVKDHRPLT